MKTLQKITLFIAFVALIASCQTATDVKQVLSNQDTKKAIMDTIANDSNLSKEMMETMMNSENSKMMMMENHESMMKMKDNPTMMKNMMRSIMETCKGDSAMMSAISTIIMEYPEMMVMMHKKGMKNME